jgi:hypothetical protein
MQGLQAPAGRLAGRQCGAKVGQQRRGEQEGGCLGALRIGSVGVASVSDQGCCKLSSLCIPAAVSPQCFWVPAQLDATATPAEGWTEACMCVICSQTQLTGSPAVSASNAASIQDSEGGACRQKLTQTYWHSPVASTCRVCAAHQCALSCSRYLRSCAGLRL